MGRRRRSARGVHIPSSQRKRGPSSRSAVGDIRTTLTPPTSPSSPGLSGGPQLTAWRCRCDNRRMKPASRMDEVPRTSRGMTVCEKDREFERDREDGITLWKASRCLKHQRIFPGSASALSGTNEASRERGFGTVDPGSAACLRRLPSGRNQESGEDKETPHTHRFPRTPFRGLPKRVRSARFRLNQAPAQGRGKPARQTA